MPEVTDNRGVELETDTAPEIEALLISRWRSMTGAQKLELVLAMSQTVRELAVAGIRARHPQASDREVLLRLAIIQHGSELASAAYPDAATLDGL